MENSNVNRLSFGASLTAKLSSLMMIVIHLYCLLTFYNGVIVTGNGLIGYAGGFNAVDVIKNTLNVASDAFSGGAGALVLLLPALHVAFLIVVIVNFINAFIRFFFLFGGGDEKFARNQKQTFLISKKLIGSGVCMLVFIMLSCWINGAYMNNSALLLIMALSVGIIVSRFANAVLIKAPFTTVITQIVYSAVMLGIIGMVMMFASCDVISEVGYAVDYILGGASSLMITSYGMTAAAFILCAVVMLNAVLMVRSCKRYALVPNDRIKKSGKNIFVCTLVAVGFIVIAEYLATKCGIKDLFTNVIKPLIPLVLAATAAFLFGMIKPKVSKPVPEDEAEDEDEDEEAPYEAPAPAPTTVPAAHAPAAVPAAAPAPAATEPKPEPKPEPKIVFVGKRVKKIKSKTYRNRKDINIIVIPESVVYVEGYSFFGCTELKEIHCERKSQTRFWHKKWNFGCPAKVTWNSAENDED
ncbi:MAG: hypothetical protein E7678_06090 [Ruminococcaceae bacterium]|nr:hypothetical protein [Oscillospiraceae bacterium]